MRIDDLTRIPITQSTEKADQAAEKRALDKGTIASSADHAEVSQLAKALGPRDPQRLEQLRLDVQTGKYDVSAEVVAKAIIDAHSKS
jgi:anti-sigma28 factor (negative regulator of flagellin synthesis)